MISNNLLTIASQSRAQIAWNIRYKRHAASKLNESLHVKAVYRWSKEVMIVVLRGRSGSQKVAITSIDMAEQTGYQ